MFLGTADDEGGGGGGGESDEDVDEYHLPISHEVVMGGHSKAVTCMDIDHSGSRIVSGRHCLVVHCWQRPLGCVCCVLSAHACSHLPTNALVISMPCCDSIVLCLILLPPVLCVRACCA